MLNIVIFGAPGSGKGTQSVLIIDKYGLNHISTGEILRKEIENQTELGKTADTYISKGKLVPDDLIIAMLSSILDAHPQNKGFVFDGFPRTLAQGEALDKMLRDHDTSIAATVNLTVEETELTERLLKRGKIAGRSDDNLETIQARLEVYKNQTEPLLAYYKKQGKLIGIHGSGTIEDIFEKISEALDRINK